MRKMFNSKVVSMLMAMIMAVMLVGHAAPAVSYAEEFSTDMVALYDAVKGDYLETELVVDNSQTEKYGTLVLYYNDTEELSKELYAKIQESLVIETNVEGFNVEKKFFS